MRTFTAFTGITPENSRYRHTDHLFDLQRRKLYGDSTIDGDYEFSVPGANITQLQEDEREGYLVELAAPGYERDDFHVSVHDDVMTIKGEQHESRQRATTASAVASTITTPLRAASVYPTASTRKTLRPPTRTAFCLCSSPY